MDQRASEEKVIQYFYEPEEKETQRLYISWCGYRKCNCNHVIGPRVLTTNKIVFVVSGKGTVEQEGFPVLQVGAGDIFVLYSGKKHHYYANPREPWELMWVAFNGTDVADIFNKTHIAQNSYMHIEKDLAGIKPLMQNLIHAMADNDDKYRIQAISYLLLLFYKMSYPMNQHGSSMKRENINEIVNKAVRFIDENYYNDINVDVLSDYVNSSRSYLSRNFRAIVGVSIPAYINKVRVESAKVLLKETNLSILEIACSVGIEDQFYFSKLFKIVAQMSPSEYRIKHYNSLPRVID